MRTRTSWREKMDNPNLPKVVDIPPNMQKRYGGSGTLLIPSPRDVDSVIRGIRKGTVMTVGQIREHLAAKYSTTSACPLVTGIFVRISAEAAEEEARAGKTRISPYWRVVRNDGSLNPKFPGGIGRQAERLRDEGVQVVNGRAPKTV
jgi:alkylated DNA nucleotide flippase Atl1